MSGRNGVDERLIRKRLTTTTDKSPRIVLILLIHHQRLREGSKKTAVSDTL
jgi:hypothetical protein